MGRERLLFAIAALILLLGILSSAEPASAAPPVTITANPTTLTIIAGQSGTVTLTVHVTGGPWNNPVVTCSGLAGVVCTTNPNPLPSSFSTGDTNFQLIISTSTSTTPGTFQVTITLGHAAVIISPPIFAIQASSLGPQQTPIQTTISITVDAPTAVGGTILPTNPFMETAWAVALAVLMLIPVIVFTRRRALEGAE